MDDYISRKVAIDRIESHIRTAEEPYQLTETDKILNHAFEVSASCIYNLPAAPVLEAKRGRWILDKSLAYIDTYYYHCSECGNERCFIGAYKANWCEECGADMREDGE